MGYPPPPLGGFFLGKPLIPKALRTKVPPRLGVKWLVSAAIVRLRYRSIPPSAFVEFATCGFRVGLWGMRKTCPRACAGDRGSSSIIGFAEGWLCQVLGSFFCFGMNELVGNGEVQGLDNFGDQGGEVGLGCLGVGREVKVAEGLGGDGAYGDALNLQWKSEA